MAEAISKAETAPRLVILRARNREIRFPRPVLIMGVVNVTPDSFSDGGRYFEPERAVDHALQLIQEGAEIVDVGGESTRPGALPVSESEELRRVLPVLEALSGRTRAMISIDTYKPRVARAAVEAGAVIVNDIAATGNNRDMWRVVQETGAAYVGMHMQGTPVSMQKNPAYGDVVAEVESFFRDQLNRLPRAGVAHEQIVLDVGIGFGKTRAHNLRLLAGLHRLSHVDRPLLLGVSRKSFLRGEAEGGLADRLPAALACSCWAVQAGVKILRTHDVRPTLQAVRMAEEIRAYEAAEAGFERVASGAGSGQKSESSKGKPA